MNDLVKNDEERFVEEEREWIEGEDPKEPVNMETAVAERIAELRHALPDGSKTAAAIDANAPWMEISQAAEQEGFHEVANLLFEAEQQGLED